MNGIPVACLVLSVFLTVLCRASTENASSQPILTLPQGTLRGKHLESAVEKRKYSAFLSIPYAKPPIGELRFKDAIPAGPWPGEVLDATREAPLCPQINIFLPPRTPTVSGTEDCLYLNVYTPKLKFDDGDKSKLLDVIVYIHGGGFVAFSGTEVGPERLLDRDVVFVTFNYRLGALGFLSAQDAVLPGNLGMKDQVLALKWVQKNIAAFGGDPSKVTIAGMSAGAASVHYHTFSPLSKGLFKRIIAESGSATNPWAFVERPVEHAKALARLVGCPTDNSKAIVDCLRTRPANHIVEAALEHTKSKESMHLPFTPTIETPSPTAFLTKHPLEVIMSGEAQDVPILFSFAEHEGLLVVAGVLGNPALIEAFDTNWNAIAPNLLDFNRTVSEDRKHAVGTQLKTHYFGTKHFAEDIDQLIKIMSDRIISSGVVESALLQAAHSASPIYLYEFCYRGRNRSTDRMLSQNVFDGVGHADNSLYTAPLRGIIDEFHKDDEPMSIELINLWLNFINDSKMPGGWKTVQEGLPKVNVMKVNKPVWSENQLESYDDYANVKFLRSLNLDGNDEFYSKRLVDEL